ncbi:MAG: DUF4395 domain-containing protein [Hylemonella sp.]|nr:DUF4395 domain-containing protein [Hylemonella sp.]
MTTLFQFGEHHPDYPVRVINEREARAGAGILFFLALIAFMNAWLSGDFAPTKLVVVGFFADFFIRVLINPRYSPSLVLGRIAVRNQIPEYVGAPQKRFAWAIGLALATLMLYLVVFNNIKGPINMLTCSLCLLLLFFETAFGICIGCKLYTLFNRERAQLCPGGVCEVKDRQPIQFVSGAQYAAVGVFLVGLSIAATLIPQAPAASAAAAADGTPAQPRSAAEEERCRVPEFAKKIGHEEKWKLHNGCK